MVKRILFVEDDVLVGKMYTEALTNHGYEVDWQPTAEASQKRLETEKYDLLLLDLLLPGVHGLDFLQQIRTSNSSYKDIPVYILTNVDGQNTIANGVAAGIQGYFLKVSTTPKKMVETLDAFFNKTSV